MHHLPPALLQRVLEFQPSEYVCGQKYSFYAWPITFLGWSPTFRPFGLGSTTGNSYTMPPCR